MRTFIKGKELCRRFFHEAALPIINRHFPGLKYTAGLLGYGSDVLGYDDEVSTDHMWGPRFYLFLPQEDMPQRARLMDAFSAQLPCEFLGYSVNFSDTDPKDGGVRHPVPAAGSRVSPLIFIDTAAGYLKNYIGYTPGPLTNADWLSFSEHKLLALQKADFYLDDLGIQELLKPLCFYPEDVKKYLLASNWSLISEEQAFVKRQLDTGDRLGSLLTASRIGERLMRLCFLYCDRYAPYSKWFGRAFGELPVNPKIKDRIEEALTNEDRREDAIAEAQLLTAELHDSKNITPPVHAAIQNYFGRDIKVIYADRIASALVNTIKDPHLQKLPLIGSMSEVSNMVRFYDDPSCREKIKGLYK